MKKGKFYNKIPRKIAGEKVFSSDWLTLNLDKVQLSSGKIIENYHRLDFNFNSVVVIMSNRNDEICFIYSSRYATQSIELELPAGNIMQDESIIHAAQREVLEETGYKLINPEFISSFHPSNAFSNNQAHIVMGERDQNINKQNYDKDEVIEIEWIKRKKIWELIRNNQIMDGHTISALLLYFSRLIKI